MYVLFLLYVASAFIQIIGDCVSSNSTKSKCLMGNCIDDTCICHDGWGGELCDTCIGRVLFNETSGIIYDGPRNYVSQSRCSWLITPSSQGKPIRFKFHEFVTECGWDHLYIYDGDSAYSPLIGSFNGFISAGNDTDKLEREVIANSGKAFIQFYSDVAASMSGFNISYTVDECQYDCFNQGNCIDGVCKCFPPWTGQTCNLCNCSYANSSTLCANEDEVLSCATSSKMGSWSVFQLNTSALSARASGALSSINNTVWMYGGMQFRSSNSDDQATVVEFTTTRKQWQPREPANGVSPAMRYEHSMVAWNQSLLVFGGKFTQNEQITNELWQYDLQSSEWSLVNYSAQFGDSNPTQLRLAGHTSCLVQFDNGTETMVVIFGYHPTMLYTRFVYEYNPSTKTWIMPRPTGTSVPGLFKHSSVYHSENKLIYIHGGYGASKTISSATFSYDPLRRHFSRLRSSDRPRYLHSAGIINGVMYVYGGSTLGGSYEDVNALCYSTSFMAYNIACDSWVVLTSPPDSLYPARYGHAAAVLPSPDDGTSSQFHIISGYDSTMISNTIIYTPASCLAYSENASTCPSTLHLDIVCYWNGTTCLHLSTADKDLLNQSSCPTVLKERQKLCQSQGGSSCADCTSNSYGCQYIDTNSDCIPDDEVDSPEVCKGDSYCASLSSCTQCETAGWDCTWKDNRCVSREVNFSTGDPSKCRDASPCDTAITCGACAKFSSCMWCLQPAKCVPVETYVIQFPYGQCLEWNKSCPAYDCSEHGTCDSCQGYSHCGWCDDGSLTGLGECVNGSGSGPLQYNETADAYEVSNEVCTPSSWFFTDCPLCQCNGHSTCNEAGECINCNDNTIGPHCETCQDGYFGVSLNGANCSPCECDDTKATTCQSETGDCNCFTKGVIGFQCQQCDTNNGYIGNATGNGTCYYPMLENYVYTFTLLAPSDIYSTKINFQNTPADSFDVTMELQSDQPCDIRLAIKSAATADFANEEVTVTTFENEQSLEFVFDNSEFQFDNDDLSSTIRIYVSNFSVATTGQYQIRVSLVQRNNVLLTILLALFSTFLVILLLSALVWKLKIIYDNRRRRENRALQMKEMAARPFATVDLNCDDVYRSTQALLSPSENVYQVIDDDDIPPHVFCEESCSDDQASVVSVFLWLPSSVPNKDRVEEDDKNLSSSQSSTCYVTPPPGQSAIVIGTLLGRKCDNNHQAVANSCVDHKIMRYDSAEGNLEAAYVNEAMQHVPG